MSDYALNLPLTTFFVPYLGERLLALCLVAFSLSSEAAPEGQAKGTHAKGKSVIPFAFCLVTFAFELARVVVCVCSGAAWWRLVCC